MTNGGTTDASPVSPGVVGKLVALRRERRVRHFVQKRFHVFGAIHHIAVFGRRIEALFVFMLDEIHSGELRHAHYAFLCDSATCRSISRHDAPLSAVGSALSSMLPPYRKNEGTGIPLIGHMPG